MVSNKNKKPYKRGDLVLVDRLYDGMPYGYNPRMAKYYNSVCKIISCTLSGRCDCKFDIKLRPLSFRDDGEHWFFSEKNVRKITKKEEAFFYLL